jgi:hypothetical protein
MAELLLLLLLLLEKPLCWCRERLLLKTFRGARIISAGWGHPGVCGVPAWQLLERH